MDSTVRFTPLEEAISFYTRNDYAIMNNLMLSRYEEVWEEHCWHTTIIVELSTSMKVVCEQLPENMTSSG